MRKLLANKVRFGAGRFRRCMVDVTRFTDDQSGATVVEYGMIAAVIASAIVSMSSTLQSGLTQLAKTLAEALAI